MNHLSIFITDRQIDREKDKRREKTGYKKTENKDKDCNRHKAVTDIGRVRERKREVGSRIILALFYYSLFYL